MNIEELYTGATINAVSEHGFRFNPIGAMLTMEGGEAHTIIFVQATPQ